MAPTCTRGRRPKPDLYFRVAKQPGPSHVQAWLVKGSSLLVAYLLCRVLLRKGQRIWDQPASDFMLIPFVVTKLVLWRFISLYFFFNSEKSIGMETFADNEMSYQVGGAIINPKQGLGKGTCVSCKLSQKTVQRRFKYILRNGRIASQANCFEWDRSHSDCWILSRSTFDVEPVGLLIETWFTCLVSWTFLEFSFLFWHFFKLIT